MNSIYADLPPLEFAMHLATVARDRIPTVDELQRDYGMSRATAYRWASRLTIVLGKAAPTVSVARNFPAEHTCDPASVRMPPLSSNALVRV